MTSNSRTAAQFLKGNQSIDAAQFDKLQKKARSMTPDEIVDKITELSHNVTHRKGRWRSDQQSLLCWKTIANMAGVSYGEDEQQQSEARAKQKEIDEQLALVGSYKQKYHQAKDRGISFELTFPEYCRIMKRKTCAYTGVAFSDLFPASLDRLDPVKPYSRSNTVKVCVQANNAKNLLLEMPKDLDKQTVRMSLSMLTKMVGKLNELGFESPDR